MENIKPDKQTAAVCGLLCKSCGVYIATQENDIALLNRMADHFKVTYEQVQCNGCRSLVLSAHCKTCSFRECSRNKEIEFCSECKEYPCSELKDFQTKMPHRVELLQSLNRIKEAGWEKWYIEAVERHTCTKCNKLNGWYEYVCSRCGNTPSSSFVTDNFEQLKSFKK